MDNFCKISETDRTIKLDVMGGSHISKCIIEAIEIAKLTVKEIEFKFNGVNLKVNKDSSVEMVAKWWDDELERQRQEYLASKEYKDMCSARESKRALDQAKIDEMVERLEKIRMSEDDLVAWVGKFADINDNIGLNIHSRTVVKALTDAGYRRNECVGFEEVKTVKTVFAKWLIGQAIDNLESGMPIHPIASNFAKTYARMK